MLIDDPMVAPKLSHAQVSVDDLVGQLSQAIGEEKAREVIVDVARSMGLVDDMSREEALEVLGRVADTPGIVGVCARFARTRLLLAGVPIGAKL